MYFFPCTNPAQINKGPRINLSFVRGGVVVELIPFPFNIPDVFKVRFLYSFHFSIARVAPEVAK